MARFWPKSRYNGRDMVREVFFIICQCLWLSCVPSLVAPGYLAVFVGPLQRVRPRNGILALGLVVLVVLVVLVLVPLRSEFIGEL